VSRVPPPPLCPVVTDASVALLCDSCPKLRKVNLSGCKRLTDVTAKALGKLKRLAFLDITRCAFSDGGLTAVVLSPGVCDNLAHLNLYAVATYTDTSFACIGVLSRLTFLDMCGSQSVTDRALAEIAEAGGCAS
jgi:F-box/leucine-rich repeat protein 2/20